MSARFPGAMGPDGFISCFDQLIPPEALKRKLILKGGPGVGKSTFMRRLCDALCPDSKGAELYFCSGDPDSLDAVVLTRKGLLIVDGTSPHVIDPQIPGARDSLINLGSCLNEAAMRPRLAQISACMQEHAAASRRARALLKAACILRREQHALTLSLIDEDKRAQMTRAVVQAALCGDAPRDPSPGVRSVITDAVTPKGEMCLLTAQSAPRIIRLECHEAMDATPILRAVSRAALDRGCSVEEHLCPANPGALLHLSIPALGLLVTTSTHLPSELLFDFSACLPAARLMRHECALEQGCATLRLLMQRAVGAMAQAKELHDELETFYVPNMDFSAWQQIFDQTLASLQS